MALKKEAIDKIAKLLKIKPEDISTALADEKEVDLTIDEALVVYTPTELQTLKNNEYNRGKEVGPEMEVKAAREKFGLEGKTIEALLDSHKAKVLADAKIEPEKKVTELQNQIATLQKTVGDFEKTVSAKDAELLTVKTDTELLKHIPADTTLPPEKVLVLMKADGYGFEWKEGKLVAKKGDAIIQDHVANPKDLKTVVTEYATENKLLGKATPPAGRGGKDSKGAAGVYASKKELVEHYTAQGKSLLGQEFLAEYEKARAVDGFIDE